MNSYEVAKGVLANLPALVKTRRRRGGLSFEQAAEQIGISRGYLSDVEKGKKQPTVSTILKILNWLAS